MDAPLMTRNTSLSAKISPTRSSRNRSDPYESVDFEIWNSLQGFVSAELQPQYDVAGRLTIRLDRWSCIFGLPHLAAHEEEGLAMGSCLTLQLQKYAVGLH